MTGYFLGLGKKIKAYWKRCHAKFERWIQLLLTKRRGVYVSIKMLSLMFEILKLLKVGKYSIKILFKEVKEFEKINMTGRCVMFMCEKNSRYVKNRSFGILKVKMGSFHSIYFLVFLFFSNIDWFGPFKKICRTFCIVIDKTWTKNTFLTHGRTLRDL